MLLYAFKRLSELSVRHGDGDRDVRGTTKDVIFDGGESLSFGNQNGKGSGANPTMQAREHLVLVPLSDSPSMLAHYTHPQGLFITHHVHLDHYHPL